MQADTKLIAYCGLYCGECGKFKSGKCPGCAENKKASWCKIRSCNIENKYMSCAECEKEGVENCKYFNNFTAKFFAFIFKSDRAKDIQYIKEFGYEKFAEEMKRNQKMCFKRNESH